MELLLQALSSFWQTLIPFCIVNSYEGGVHLRGGKFLRELSPGFYFVIPGYDATIIETVVDNSETLPMQRLTTSDGVACCVSPIVVYKVRHVQKFILEVEGRESFLGDGLGAAVSRYVRTNKWEDLVKEENLEELLKAVRKRSFKYGVEVTSVEFSDIVKVRAFAILDHK